MSAEWTTCQRSQLSAPSRLRQGHLTAALHLAACHVSAWHQLCMMPDVVQPPVLWSQTQASCVQVDPDTYDMLKTLNMSNLPGVEKVTVSPTPCKLPP